MLYPLSLFVLCHVFSLFIAIGEVQHAGKAVGNLLPLLEIEMERVLSEDAHTIINEREGVVALAHRELFPRNRPVLTTNFDTRESLIDAVCDSSMFPFFSTQWPARLRYDGGRLPKVVVDGFFSVPRERYGCPDFKHLNYDKELDKKLRDMGGVLVDESGNEQQQNDEEETPVIDRTITVACFPHETVGLSVSSECDQISPAPDYDDPVGQMKDLFRYATQPSSRKELEMLYEKGWEDAEKWTRDEELREKKLADEWIKQRRHDAEVQDAIKRGDLF